MYLCASRGLQELFTRAKVIFMAKHIVLINTWRVVNAKGGTEKVFCDMANALVSMGYAVTAICFDKFEGDPGFPINSLVRFINARQKNGLCRFLDKNVRSFSFNKNVWKKNRFELDRDWKLRRLESILGRLPPADLFISFQPASANLLLEIQSRRAPIVTMLHGDPISFSGLSEYEFICNSMAYVDLLTVLMPAFVSSAHEVFPNAPIKVIPNAIPEYESLAKLEAKKIICVARLARQKRIELLLEAFYMIKEKYPDWVVEIWGEKDVESRYGNYILRLAGKLKLSNQVRFMGITSQVEKVLESASVFAFPSLFEGFPLALGEAMSKGLPSVGCIDCPGVNDLIKNERNGLLVAPSSEAFSNALSRLIDGKDLRRKLGAQAKKDISEYCPEKIWSKWDDLIKKLTSSRK